MSPFPTRIPNPLRPCGVVAVVLLFLSWLVIPATQAASFDCKKASSTVEKLICADDELSRLDTTLDSIYRSEHSVRSAANKKSFEREQGGWRRVTRDACKTRECIRDAYFARLATLDQVDERYIKDWKYPPYPQVWGHDFKRVTCENTISGAWYAPNGDVLIRYVRCSSSSNSYPGSTASGNHLGFGYREFFAQKDHAISVDEFNRFHERFASPGSPQSPFSTSLLRFRNGNILSYVEGGECTQGPYTGHFELKAQNGQLLWRKLVLVRDKPRKIICNFPGSIDYHLSFYPSRSRLVLLHDDTFLMWLDNNLIRFDSRFKTRFPYNSKRIYIVDYEGVQAVIERAKKRCDPYETCLDDEMKHYLNSLK